MTHRTEAVLTGAAAAGCAYLATGSATSGRWLALAVFAVLAPLLARISYREQLLARWARDEAVRAEMNARMYLRPPHAPHADKQQLLDEDGDPVCTCTYGALCPHDYPTDDDTTEDRT